MAGKSKPKKTQEDASPAAESQESLVLLDKKESIQTVTERAESLEKYFSLRLTAKSTWNM